jgi:small neutral amino acid transporter SnatA (MarC family)
MFGFSGVGLWNNATTVIFKEYGLFMLASFICSLPLYDIFRKNFRVPDGAIRIAGGFLLVALTLVAVTYVATNNYNPFIYFNF